MSWSASRLRQLRLELGWSQAEMGRRLGMDTNRWNAIEAGQVSIDIEAEVEVERLSQQLRDYSRSLRFSSHSESYMDENRLNQISQFDLESFEDS